jgi:hypothetical protein
VKGTVERRRHIDLALLAVVASCCVCRTPPSSEGLRPEDHMLDLLLPSRIEIVEPFTRVKSFDDDEQPDGIELLLRAVNSLDNPGLMIVGDVVVELYEHVPASGDAKGRQLDSWRIPLRTREDQKRFWNQLTQMYEFRLEANPRRVPRSGRFELMVTYVSPLGTHLTDEFLLEYRMEEGSPGELRRVGR